MLRLTNLADYAVIIMLHTAHAEGNLVTAAFVAHFTNIPLPTVAKVAGLLAKAGLLKSQRGASGGFQLSKPPEAINVAEIVEAVDGPIALTQCVEPKHLDHTHKTNADCALQSHCAMQAPWQVINQRVRNALLDVRLSDLPRPMAAPMQNAAANSQLMNMGIDAGIKASRGEGAEGAPNALSIHTSSI
jgi:FeS assembly SUF system regulator